MEQNIYQYFLDILQAFRKYSSFKKIDLLDVNTKNDKNETIRFTTFSEKNDYDDQYLIVIFHKDTNIKATCKYIRSKHYHNILKLKKHIILYFRGKRTTDADEKIIQEILSPKKIFKVEQLIKDISEKTVSDIFDSKSFVTPNAFVFPKINQIKYNEKNEETRILYNDFTVFQKKFLDKWFDNKDKSILVIKGQGGIGKTTIAKYFANYFLRKNPHTSKIFIDSLDAKNYLLDGINKRKSSQINLFELYKASLKGENYLSKKLFQKNLDAGNFFLIIDGIDELISKVKNFDIDIFLHSIKEYYSEIQNTKIIITCRSYFWNLEKSDEYKIDTIEILPFSYSQAEEFFSKSFNGNIKNINNALELAKEFHKNKNTQDNFHPYALDIISRIISSQKNIDFRNIDSFSKLLNPNITLDYIVDRICNRENFLLDKVRILDLTVDEQINVFKNIAVKHNGKISVDLLEDCISNSISSKVKKSIPISLIEAFKTHLLVDISDEILSFKYDFLNDFFKSVYIANYFSLELGEDKISNELLNLFKIASFGSSLTKEVSQRLTKWSDDEILKLSDLVSQIDKEEIRDKIKVFSGIFNIAFYANSKFKGNNTIENTKLIFNIFEYSKNTLKNLCIINVFDNKNKIKFDFSNTTLIDCYFINYENFWDCTFNENVFFTNCTILKVGLRKSKDEIPFDLNRNVDKNCIFDDSFKTNFVISDKFKEEFQKRISNFTHNFLRFFYTRGNLWSRNYKDDQGKYNTLIVDYASFGNINIDFQDFISLMIDIELIKIGFHNKHQVEKVEINKKYESDIIKYLEEQTESEIIKKIQDTLYNYIRNN